MANDKPVLATIKNSDGKVGIIVTTYSNLKVLINSESSALEKFNAVWQIAGSASTWKASPVMNALSLAINPASAILECQPDGFSCALRAGCRRQKPTQPA